MHKIAQLAVLVLALPVAAQPQFVTLERASPETRIGVQGSLAFYPDLDDFADVNGLRLELFGQFAGQLRGGGTLGGYGHIALGYLLVDEFDDESAVGGLELGGYYVTALGPRSDATFKLGLALPTAGDDEGDVFVNVLTGLERHYDLVNSIPDTTALRLSGTLRTQLGMSGFLQGDLGLDLILDAPDDDTDVLFHANVGLGAYLGSAVFLGELALTFDDDYYLGSLGLGFRFMSSVKPHIGYLMVFGDEDFRGDGIIAHLITFGFYADL
jgi:hypothetical protein